MHYFCASRPLSNHRPIAQYIDTSANTTHSSHVSSTWWRIPTPPSPRPSPCVKGPKRRVLQPLTRPHAYAPCTSHAAARKKPRCATKKKDRCDVMRWSKKPHAEETACRTACRQARVSLKQQHNIATLPSAIDGKPITFLPLGECIHMICDHLDRPLKLLLIAIPT
jgi:hypothetical protein